MELVLAKPSQDIVLVQFLKIKSINTFTHKVMKLHSAWVKMALEPQGPECFQIWLHRAEVWVVAAKAVHHSRVPAEPVCLISGDSACGDRRESTSPTYAHKRNYQLVTPCFSQEGK